MRDSFDEAQNGELMLFAKITQKISGKVTVREKLGNSITEFSKMYPKYKSIKTTPVPQDMDDPESKNKQPETTKKSPPTKNPQQGWEV